jgi:hypothetical protein
VLFVDLLAETLSFDQLHGDEVVLRAVDLTDSDLVHDDDVRVIETRRGLRLLDEAPHPLLAAGQVGGEHFQRDVAVERGVARAVDLAHSPAADPLDDPVSPERSAAGQALSIGPGHAS